MTPLQTHDAQVEFIARVHLLFRLVLVGYVILALGLTAAAYAIFHFADQNHKDSRAAIAAVSREAAKRDAITRGLGAKTNRVAVTACRASNDRAAAIGAAMIGILRVSEATTLVQDPSQKPRWDAFIDEAEHEILPAIKPRRCGKG